ncbi:MAG: hypothetical protein M1469_02885 [Bacteroidetes bacterium]|nr:hypothetical protein [Bacteroidota bacterium]
MSSLFAFLSLLNLAAAQGRGTAYQWPIKPGTADWKALQTHDEMLAVLQIPVDILEKMSTEDLVETCLNYPLFPDVWAFNSFQEGVDKAIAGFNGFRELIARAGAGKPLSERYQQIDLADLDNKKTYNEQGDFIMHMCKLGTLLSQYAVLQNMSRSDRIALLRNSLYKNKVILADGRYSVFGYESNLFLAVRILSVENSDLFNKKLEEDKDFKRFVEQGTGITERTLNDIIEISNGLLSGGN